MLGRCSQALGILLYLQREIDKRRKNRERAKYFSHCPYRIPINSYSQIY